MIIFIRSWRSLFPQTRQRHLLNHSASERLNIYLWKYYDNMPPRLSFSRQNWLPQVNRWSLWKSEWHSHDGSVFFGQRPAGWTRSCLVGRWSEQTRGSLPSLVGTRPQEALGCPYHPWVNILDTTQDKAVSSPVSCQRWSPNSHGMQGSPSSDSRLLSLGAFLHLTICDLGRQPI